MVLCRWITLFGRFLPHPCYLIMTNLGGGRGRRLFGKAKNHRCRISNAQFFPYYPAEDIDGAVHFHCVSDGLEFSLFRQAYPLILPDLCARFSERNFFSLSIWFRNLSLIAVLISCAGLVPPRAGQHPAKHRSMISRIPHTISSFSRNIIFPQGGLG